MACLPDDAAPSFRPRGGDPMVSVVVVLFDIPREGPRTLRSLASSYQRYIQADEYEVIVVDNGSTPPVDLAAMDGLDGCFRLIRIDRAPVSPAQAINRGLAAARGDVLGVMVDGARLATPGLLHFARHAAALYERAVVVTPGWYLGPDFQWRSRQRGYDQAREDALLASIEWPRDGYRLFEIGTLDESSSDGWRRPLTESNAVFLRREFWRALGGVEERFDAPGGGLLNLDTLRRAVESPGARLVVLAGEGTFHQLHGGVSTNATLDERRERLRDWRRQYEALRGRPYAPPSRQGPPSYLGEMRWPALSGLLRREARLLRADIAAAIRRPSTWLPRHRRVAAHVRLAHLALRLGAHAFVRRHCTAALSLDPDCLAAQMLLVALALPGEDYLEWLRRLYGVLQPETAIEIGIFRGTSFSLFRPPTLAIGVDPDPCLEVPLSPTARVVRETSDEFFRSGGAAAALGGRPVSVGFIDGLHLFEQALKDFINLEALSGPRSIVLVHDTLPLDELSQRRTTSRRFHTGDVWKLVPCLKHYRPDLDVWTIATPPTGLTVIANLNPASRVLAERYEDAVARFIDASYADMAADRDAALNVVPNDWAMVRARLERAGVLTSDVVEPQPAMAGASAAVRIP